MTRPGPMERREQAKPRERKRDALLLAGSVLFHIILFLLLPALTSPVPASMELIVEIVGKPEPEQAGSMGAGGGTSPVAGDVDSASSKPIAPGPQHQQQAAGAPKQPQADAKPKDSGGGQPSKPAESHPATTNEATAVVPPTPIVVKPVTPPEEKVPPPAETPKAKPEETPPPVQPPKVEPKEKPAPALPKVKVEDTPPPQEGERDQAQPSPAPDKKEQPQPGQGEGAESGSGGEQPGGQPSGSGNDSAGADDKGQGSSGDAAGTPGPPPGPTAAELDLLKDYGDKARKRIRMLARNPERATEQHLKGKVTFEFEVSNTGKLLGVKVLRTSSHPVLDEECLDATKVAAPFGRFPKGVSVKKWKFEMTLEFPLY